MSSIVPKLPPKGGKRRPAQAVARHEHSEDEDAPTSPKRGKDTHSTADTGNQAKETAQAGASGSGYIEPLSKCLNNMASFNVGGSRDADCTNALLYMVAVDTMPLCTPERKGFRAFCKTLQPMYKIPCEDTTTKRLEEKYYYLRDRMGSLLREAKNITLTTDIWTHQCTMKSYLGMTAHFRQGTKPITVELGARPLDERKTSDNIQLALRNFCSDWQILYNRVRGVVTDGGANIKKAVKEEFGEEKHISCVAHKINIIGQKVVGLYGPGSVPSEQQNPPQEVPDHESDIESDEDEDTPSEQNQPGAQGDEPERALLKRLVKKLKRIVRFTRQSEIATSMLKKKLKDAGLPYRKLIQEVRTRFNSCFAMIERYLALSRFVTAVLLDLQRDRLSKSKVPPILDGDEEEALSEVMELLRPLNDVTLEVSSEKNVTLSKCIPLIKNLKTAVDEFMPITPIGYNLKADLQKNIKTQFGQIESIRMFACATILDPRYKKVGFTSDERKPLVIANTLSFVSDLVKAKMRESRAAEASSSTTDTLQTASTTSASGSARSGTNAGLWERFDQEVESHVKDFCGQDLAGGIPVQLRTFLDSPPVPRKTNPDPIVAWEAFRGEYPYVYPVAQEYLSLLASSAPCERLFSHAGLVASQLRNRLTGKHVEMMVFLRSCEESLWFS